ncbi:MAG: EutN/CcmL family microcompartment protein [Acidobacteria bacterium]|nr:EutN/CcmL family microcompartment protein [Acidobacteriota bacterium]
MYLGRVTGCVWSTAKDPNLSAQKLLIVQPLNTALEPNGRQIVCTDAVGVGIGETIYYCRGKESSFPFLPVEVPTDTTIVAVVDSVRVE